MLLFLNSKMAIQRIDGGVGKRDNEGLCRRPRPPESERRTTKLHRHGTTLGSDSEVILVSLFSFQSAF